MSKKAKLSQLNKEIKKGAAVEKSSKKEPKIRINPERGGRSSFLKITITIPPEMLGKLRQMGIERKTNGMIDTDVSSLIREAVSLLFDQE